MQRRNNGAPQSHIRRTAGETLSNSRRSTQDNRRLLPTNDSTAVDSCSDYSLDSNRSDDDNLEQEAWMLNKQMTEQEKQEEQRSKLRALYDEGKGVMYCRNVARDIRCAVRDYLVCKVKFVDIANKKTFPSFMLHDFTNSKHFITRFVDDKLNYGDETMENKTAFWITYRRIVKKEISNHRATCASTMKEAFLKGK